MEFTYETIKRLAKETGRRVTDLIALAGQNDPFYAGTPGEVTLAEWFADFYHSRFLAGTRVHVRRCHYKILSLEMSLPDGKPYENTERCWDILLQATKAARYLRLVDVGLFEDRKNDDPIIYSDNSTYEPDVSVDSYLYAGEMKLPDFPDLPYFSINSYYASQRYNVELWCEKSTMNDILVPFCRRYGAVLQTGAGELSITATKSLADRIEQSGKPTRIFYISDYDPAGQSMPVAVARKLEWFVRSFEDTGADVRLFPVVLTAQQVQQYRLPRTPIKESEKRKDAFEARHGQGATELDALEALYPGELRRVLTRYIERYYDTTLSDRVEQAKDELKEHLRTIHEDVLDRYAERIQEARDELEGIRSDFAKSDFAARMQTYVEHLEELWQAVGTEMQEATPDLDEYPVPTGEDAEELGDGLYNSERDYLGQIDVYKQFQGKQQ